RNSRRCSDSAHPFARHVDGEIAISERVGECGMLLLYAETIPQRILDCCGRFRRVVTTSSDGEGVAAARFESHDRYNAACIGFAAVLYQPHVGGEAACCRSDKRRRAGVESG